MWWTPPHAHICIPALVQPVDVGSGRDVTQAGWDGSIYDAVSGPQLDAGRRVVSGLNVLDGGVIVDAGCGSGRVTELILDAWANVTVVAMDVSSSMLSAAENRLRRYAGRVELIQADLTDAWPLQAPVDAVVSTNTFHWILDHRALFAAAHDAIKPGGQLLAVAGGSGSLESVRTTARRVGVGVEGMNNYADPEHTADLLGEAGFVEVRCWLDDEPVRFPTHDDFVEYLANAALAPYDRGAELASRVADDLAEPVADFVRLNIIARRSTPHS